MDVHIGKDDNLYILKNVHDEIISFICRNHYETGGIIGFDENGVVSAFQPDQIKNPDLYEYHPNIVFLNKILQDDWGKSKISFAGFVHSHLHNDSLSREDVAYGRKILQKNSFLPYVLMGIIDLSREQCDIKWYCVKRADYHEQHMEVL